MLFVADRYPRTYSPQQIALLDSLAAFAAVAMENARLFEESRDALERERRANAEIQSAAEVHERLSTLLASGGELDELTDVVARELDGHVLVVDDGLRPLSWSGPEPCTLDPELRRAFERSREIGRSVHVAEPGRVGRVGRRAGRPRAVAPRAAVAIAGPHGRARGRDGRARPARARTGRGRRASGDAGSRHRPVDRAAARPGAPAARSGALRRAARRAALRDRPAHGRPVAARRAGRARALGADGLAGVAGRRHRPRRGRRRPRRASPDAPSSG